jgi:hypothetical protein
MHKTRSYAHTLQKGRVRGVRDGAGKVRWEKLFKGWTILDKMLDKSISTDGNPKSNVAVNYKGCGRKQGTEVREGGVGCKHALCGSVRISRRDTLDENLGLVEV